MRPDAPSATARMVARGVAYVAGDPRWRHLAPPGMAEEGRALLAACAPSERRALALLERPAVRGLVAFVEGIAAPGILLHYVLRKRRLEEEARAAVADGFRQVVVLGAGLDTLALRLHREHPDVRFVEVDRPATQACKKRHASGAGPNLRMVTADLGRRRLSAALVAGGAGFERGDDTLFLAEGLLMYLTAAQAGSLFGGVRDAVAPGARCRLAFTFVEPQIDGRPDFSHASRALRVWLRLRGEPFRWGIHRDELPAFLSLRGFALQAIETPEELRRRYLGARGGDVGPVNGDIVCVADRRRGRC